MEHKYYSPGDKFIGEPISYIPENTDVHLDTYKEDFGSKHYKAYSDLENVTTYEKFPEEKNLISDYHAENDVKPGAKTSFIKNTVQNPDKYYESHHKSQALNVITTHPSSKHYKLKDLILNEPVSEITHSIFTIENYEDIATSPSTSVITEPVDSGGDTPVTPAQPDVSLSTATPAAIAKTTSKPANTINSPQQVFAPDAHINLSEEEIEYPQLVAWALETQHYVKRPPRFAEQVKDVSRTNYVLHRGSSADAMLITEHEGLVELDEFLQGLRLEAEVIAGSQSINEKLVTGLMDNLTFIGEKEYQEGARGLAAMWKQYLEEHAQNVLCVSQYQVTFGNMNKSGLYLLDRILDCFTDEELEKYQGRILTKPEKLQSEPEHTRIVMLDDWTISGEQMKGLYNTISSKIDMSKYAGCIEINLLTATEERIQMGSCVISWAGTQTMVPVKAYFKAHDARDSSSNGAHITGSHCSVDYDFQNDLNEAVGRINLFRQDNTSWGQIPDAPLTAIHRPYWGTEPSVVVDDDGKIVRRKQHV